MIIYKSNNITVKYNEELNSIIHIPVNLIMSEDWRNSFTVGLNYLLLQQDKKINWINDLTNFYGVDTSDIFWMHLILNKKMNQLTYLLKNSFIEPEIDAARILMNMYIDWTMKDYGDKMICGKFNSMDGAKSWLLQSI